MLKTDISSQIKNIREALTIGLHCYGEIERIAEHQQSLDEAKMKFPDGMRPVHPTGFVGTVTDFARALRDLEYLARLNDEETQA